MSYTLVLNSSNVIGNTNSAYQFQFINGNFTVPQNAKMCVSNITMPYSWYNITSNYGNNTFQIIDWLGNTYTIVLPDGYYSVTDLMNYIEFFCIQSGLYLINATGQNVFYINLLVNQNYYSVQLLTYIVPTSLPTDWTMPSNFIGFPTDSFSPALVVLDNGFQSIIGYSVGIYGNSDADQSFLSNTIVNATPVNSLVIQCSIVNNRCGNPPNILDSMPINSAFGTNINYTPYFEKWVKLQQGTYNSLTITFVDQNYNTVFALDPNVCITLLISSDPN